MATDAMTVRVDLPDGRGYDVRIGTGLLAGCGEAARRALGQPCRMLVVSDDTVFPLYGAAVTDALSAAGFAVDTFVFPHGEGSKTDRTLVALWARMAQIGMTRSDCLAALGGGVVGDLTGFAAATYLRGIRYLQLPTTLLAMVDSAIGGKTAIDLPQGKNLAGCFWHPALVVADTAALDTLPAAERRGGLAEVVKYGVIRRPALLDTLRDGTWDAVETVAACVREKRDIVQEDERDTGVRQLLNFGHTVGHAAEVCSGYTLPHGHAVAAGMAIITRAAARRGICAPQMADDLQALLSRLGLPIAVGYTAEELFRAALRDKKRDGDRLTLILPHAFGDVRPERIAAEQLRGWIEAGLTP